jgi:hypothetical protein
VQPPQTNVSLMLEVKDQPEPVLASACVIIDLHQSARASPMLLAGSTSSKCFWTLPRSLTSCKADALGIGALQSLVSNSVSGAPHRILAAGRGSGAGRISELRHLM